MAKCESCGHEFTNFFRRKACPRCGEQLRRSSDSYVPAASSSASPDDGFDTTGFAIGMLTGVPISPSRGISMGAVVGSMLHSNPAHSSTPTPDPSPSSSSSYDSSPSSSPSYDSSSSSSSYDSGSSSSSSFDSGSSFGGDAGGTW